MQLCCFLLIFCILFLEFEEQYWSETKRRKSARKRIEVCLIFNYCSSLMIKVLELFRKFELIPTKFFEVIKDVQILLLLLLYICIRIR